jgi:crossover junction endodeoxyribonuclease RuvC
MPAPRPLIIGCDPGFSGAVALYNFATQRLVRVESMPIQLGGVFSQSGGDGRAEIDVVTLARLLASAAPQAAFAVLEKVDSSPQMGVVSSFRFGQTFGILQGVAAGVGLPVKYAYPAAWKSGMGLTKNKGDSLKLACTLFPEWAGTFRRDAKSADLAEAALLAKFGERFLPATQK